MEAQSKAVVLLFQILFVAALAAAAFSLGVRLGHQFNEASKSQQVDP